MIWHLGNHPHLHLHPWPPHSSFHQPLPPLPIIALQYDIQIRTSQSVHLLSPPKFVSSHNCHLSKIESQHQSQEESWYKNNFQGHTLTRLISHQTSLRIYTNKKNWTSGTLICLHCSDEYKYRRHDRATHYYNGNWFNWFRIGIIYLVRYNIPGKV